MKYLLSILFCYSLLLSQSFVIDQNFAQINIGDTSYDKPFLGGFNKPKIQWIDWDVDEDLDLFLLDANGYLRFMKNQGSPSIPNFKFITASFQNIFCGGWFYFADYNFDGYLDLMVQNSDNSDNVSYFKNNEESS